MTWANWTTYAGTVLDWIFGLFASAATALMSNPVFGVPIILGFVGLAISLVVRFLGGITSGGKNSKED